MSSAQTTDNFKGLKCGEVIRQEMLSTVVITHMASLRKGHTLSRETTLLKLIFCSFLKKGFTIVLFFFFHVFPLSIAPFQKGLGVQESKQEV